MKDYRSRTPRAALGLIAIAMAFLTLGALVALPAKLEAADTQHSAPTAAALRESGGPHATANAPPRTGT